MDDETYVEPGEEPGAESEDVPSGDDEEPVDGDGDEGASEVPGDETEAAAPALDDRAVDKAIKALEKEAQRHAGRVADIMGEDAQILVPCELCAPSIPGFRWPQPPAAPVVAAVKAAIGEPAQPEYEKDNYSRVCDSCKGLGATATGSKVAGQSSVQCHDCKGRGWIPVGPERQGGQVAVTHGAPPALDYGATQAETALPPEAEALKALGFIVVPPIEPMAVPPVPGA